MTRTWRETARSLGIAVPAYKAAVFDFLEACGHRFCVDFGTENAIAIARKHWQAMKAGGPERIH